jgi:anti-sigma B factor antagonist
VPGFELRVERTDALTHIELVGELDLSGAERFRDALETIQARRLVLDLRGLTFIDSTGLQMILRAWERSREEGFVLEIFPGRDQIEKILRITGLDDMLPIVDQISVNSRAHARNDRRM